MKKVIIFSCLGLLILVVALVTQPDVSNSNSAIQKQDSAVAGQSLVQDREASFAYPSKEVEQLAGIKRQCLDHDAQLRSVINENHNVVMNAIIDELRRGVTKESLYSYRKHYDNFYGALPVLVENAIEKDKKSIYRISESEQLLQRWRGLSVLERLTPESVQMFVDVIAEQRNSNFSINIPLALKTDITKEEVYRLLENQEDFNTYLQSPFFTHYSTVISPSLLFIGTAHVLNLQEFESAVTAKTFTVNEVAAAIQVALPLEHLKVLMDKVEDLDGPPVFATVGHREYRNLFDLAAASKNVGALKLLLERGVEPLIEFGRLTPTDYAVHNTGSMAINNFDMSNHTPEKVIATLEYLDQLGLSAHGEKSLVDGEERTFFVADMMHKLSLSEVKDKDVAAAMGELSITPFSSQSQPQNTEEISGDFLAALQKANEIKQQYQERGERCKTIDSQILAAQQLLGLKDAYKVINEVEGTGGDVEGGLQKIDPVLVNLWHSMSSGRGASTDIKQSIQRLRKSQFIKLLADERYQEALEYASVNELNQMENDTLFAGVVREFEHYFPIWQVRVTPMAPESLGGFTEVPLSTWQKLEEGGFDMTIRDKADRGLFEIAMHHREPSVAYLLSLGLEPDIEGTGVDVLDFLLEKSYQRGSLDESLGLVLPAVSQIELNHFSRVVRLQYFYPEVYQALILLDERLIPPANTKMNEYQLKIIGTEAGLVM